MSYISDASFEDRVRARIAQGTIDVPVFTRALQGSIRPISAPSVRPLSPLPTIKVTVPRTQVSILRVDSGRGQTPESTHSVEVSRVFREDPTLIRGGGDSEKLLRHVHSLSDMSVVIAPSTPVVTSTEKSSIHSNTTSSVELAPASWRPPHPYLPSMWGVVAGEAKGMTVLYASLLLSILSDFYLFFGWLRSKHVSEKVAKLCIQLVDKSGSFILSFLRSLRTLGMRIGQAETELGVWMYRGIHAGFVWLKQACKRSARTTVHACSSVLISVFSTCTRFITQIRRIKISSPTIRFSLPVLTVPQVPKLSRPRISVKPIISALGQVMIIGSIVLFLMTAGPIIRLQVGDWWNQSRIAITGKANEPTIKETLMDTVRKPEEVPPEEKQFQLEIPKIKANLKVIPNVDAGDEKAYTEALAKGVAHAAGSGLPGEKNTTNRTIYIFGHSTNAVWNIEKYNALFYSLKDMEKGDDISVWFWGKQFHYTVTNVVKIDPSDLSYLEPQTLKDQLILQTCWPPGTTWKRLLVIAEPVTP